MDDTEKLNELAARCEASDGPDRDLDWMVADAIGHQAFERKVAIWPPFMPGSKLDKTVPYYTASLEAAMTLVPEGWNWMAGNRDQPVARAYVNNGQLHYAGYGTRRNPKHLWSEVVAATPALALTAAALKARALAGEGATEAVTG